MYSLYLTVNQGSAPVCKGSAGPCLRCPPSTSGRPFGASPSVDRNHSRPEPSTERVLQTLPAMVRSAQRLVRLEAVRGNKQEKTNKSNGQPATNPGEQNFMSQSSGYLSGIVNDLLYGAASRMERGQTTCIKCKGSGTCLCANCKGQGVVQPDKLKRAADPVRQAANKVSSMLGGSNSSQYNPHMVRSNRCQKCRGSGQCTCSACQGHGFRGDNFE
ncbi:TPA: hypothetical protein ACH3X1_011314 [Trebouxia sp. C0004]